MFYDDVFRRITESSAFSVEGRLVVTNGDTSSEHVLHGIFCSGNYGEAEYDKGYSLKKTVKRQTFRVSKSSLPSGIAAKDLLRNRITVEGKDWVVDDVLGNDSGILTLVLKG